MKSNKFFHYFFIRCCGQSNSNISTSNKIFLGLVGLMVCCLAGCAFDASGLPEASDNNIINNNNVNSSNSNNVIPLSCGDGIVHSSEGCDDSNSTDGDGCSQSCQVEIGWDCSGEPSTCVVVCGDGIVHSSEGCDDSNSTDGDGCSQFCQVESGWDCEHEPSTCLPICGDSQTQGTETCDDGNTLGGDGCSAFCQLEPYHGDLVAYWTMDESSGSIASDSTGVSDGTLQNMSAESWVAGHMGNALDFDGSDDYVSVGYIGTYERLTIALWVNIDTVYMSSLFHCDGWGAGDLHFMITSGGTVRFSINGNNSTDQDSDYLFSTHLNEWHHIAVVYDMNAMVVDFFIDGVHDVQRSYTNTRTVELGPLRIGSAECCGRFFDGRIDDLRIYNAVVSDTHINYLAGL
jgi:cysteine-rich repeat protein